MTKCVEDDSFYHMLMNVYILLKAYFIISKYIYADHSYDTTTSYPRVLSPMLKVEEGGVSVGRSVKSPQSGAALFIQY